MTTHCPCGGDMTAEMSLLLSSQGARHFVRCRDCYASGPVCTTPEAADAAWRLLTGQPAPAAVELALAKIELRPRDRKGLVALAAKLDVSPQCLDHWQAGHAPTGDARSRLLRLIVSG